MDNSRPIRIICLQCSQKLHFSRIVQRSPIGQGKDPRNNREHSEDRPSGAREPHFWEALISLVSLVAGISLSIVVYGLDTHIPMLLGVMVAALVALRCGFSWQIIQNGMVRGITNALPATIILITVEILIRV